MSSDLRRSTLTLCPNHPDAELIDDDHSGTQVCSRCGLVLQELVINEGPEWRNFEGKNDRGRVGPAENPFFDGKYLGTILSDARKENFNSIFVKAFRNIGEVAERLNVTGNVPHRAKGLFKEIYYETNQLSSLRVKSPEIVAIACLHLACRDEGVSRTFKEMCSASGFSKKKIGRCVLTISQRTKVTMRVTCTGDIMHRFCSKLSLSCKVQEIAQCIAKRAVDYNILKGRSPVSVAAATIYMTTLGTKDNLSRQEIGEVTGAAASTILKMYKLMYPHAKRLFPDDFIFSESIPKRPKM